MKTFADAIEWYYARPPEKRVSPQFVSREEWDMLVAFAEIQNVQGLAVKKGSILLLGTEFIREVPLTDRVNQSIRDAEHNRTVRWVGRDYR